MPVTTTNLSYSVMSKYLVATILATTTKDLHNMTLSHLFLDNSMTLQAQ